MTWNDDVPQIPSDEETIKHLNSERKRFEREAWKMTEQRDRWHEEARRYAQDSNFWRKRYKRLKRFIDERGIGMSRTMEYYDIAEIVHATVRQYNIVHEVPGDNFEWDDMDESYRKSIEKAVQDEIKNPTTEPDESHKKWLKAREDDGWVYGPIKDQEKKQHPCMVPYEELPEVQQYKDILFVTMVALLKHAPAVDLGYDD